MSPPLSVIAPAASSMFLADGENALGIDAPPQWCEEPREKQQRTRHEPEPAPAEATLWQDTVRIGTPLMREAVPYLNGLMSGTRAAVICAEAGAAHPLALAGCFAVGAFYGAQFTEAVAQLSEGKAPNHLDWRRLTKVGTLAAFTGAMGSGTAATQIGARTANLGVAQSTAASTAMGATVGTSVLLGRTSAAISNKVDGDKHALLHAATDLPGLAFDVGGGVCGYGFGLLAARLTQQVRAIKAAAPLDRSPQVINSDFLSGAIDEGLAMLRGALQGKALAGGSDAATYTPLSKLRDSQVSGAFRKATEGITKLRDSLVATMKKPATEERKQIVLRIEEEIEALTAFEHAATKRMTFIEMRIEHESSMLMQVADHLGLRKDDADELLRDLGLDPRRLPYDLMDPETLRNTIFSLRAMQDRIQSTLGERETLGGIAKALDLDVLSLTPQAFEQLLSVPNERLGFLADVCTQTGIGSITALTRQFQLWGGELKDLTPGNLAQQTGGDAMEYFGGLSDAKRALNQEFLQALEQRFDGRVLSEIEDELDQRRLHPDVLSSRDVKTLIDQIEEVVELINESLVVPRL